MNHDATHCADYRRSCPKRCWRAQLTEDLLQRPDLERLPVGWAKLRGSEYCPMTERRTGGK